MHEKEKGSVNLSKNCYPWLQLYEFKDKIVHQKYCGKRNLWLHFAKEIYLRILGRLIIILPSQIAWVFFAILTQ